MLLYCYCCCRFFSVLCRDIFNVIISLEIVVTLQEFILFTNFLVVAVSKVLLVLLFIIIAIHLIVSDLVLFLNLIVEIVLLLLAEVCFLNILIQTLDTEHYSDDRTFLPVEQHFAWDRIYKRTGTRHNFHRLWFWVSLVVCIHFIREYLPKPIGNLWKVNRLIDTD